MASTSDLAEFCNKQAGEDSQLELLATLLQCAQPKSGAKPKHYTAKQASKPWRRYSLHSKWKDSIIEFNALQAPSPHIPLLHVDPDCSAETHPEHPYCLSCLVNKVVHEWDVQLQCNIALNCDPLHLRN